ncbi:50S ribosomal protein L15 [Candidatus Saccharibacteria bacterium]|nr:50S ribosomal protein L15 [Candidatus Saccharibacteria bacterium]
MKYNELTLSRQKKSRQVGRGISAGRGKTAGRGTKGQGSRKSSTKAGFEGGQNPLYARLPKLRGFKSHRRGVETVYTGQLDLIKKAKIDNQAVFEAGLIRSPNSRVKLVVKGKLESKKDVQLQAASKQATEVLAKAGGSFNTVAQVGRPAKKPSSELSRPSDK